MCEAWGVGASTPRTALPLCRCGAISLVIVPVLALTLIPDPAGSSLLGGLFSSCKEWGLRSLAVHRLLIVAASLVAELRLYSLQAMVVAATGL